LVQLSNIVKDAPEGFSVFSGEDALNFPILCCGGKGVISVTANVLPQKVHDLVELTQKGDLEKARQIHFYLAKMNAAMFYETNPIPVKEALYLMGKIEPEFRLPICRIQDNNLQKLESVLREYKLI